MTKDTKVAIVLLIVLAIVFGGLAYLDLRPKQEEITPEEAVAGLDTSEKLIDYLNKNFSDKGAEDMALFAAHTLYQNDFTSFVIKYQYVSEDGDKSGVNFVAEFRDTDLPKYIYFDEQGAHLVHHGWSFEDLCRKEEERLGIKITKYGTISPLATELVPKEWVERK